MKLSVLLEQWKVKVPEKKKEPEYLGTPHQLGCIYGYNKALSDLLNLDVPELKPHACTCNRHPDSAFTVRVVNGLSICPRCGGVCIPKKDVPWEG